MASVKTELLTFAASVPETRLETVASAQREVFVKMVVNAAAVVRREICQKPKEPSQAGSALAAGSVTLCTAPVDAPPAFDATGAKYQVLPPARPETVAV